MINKTFFTLALLLFAAFGFTSCTDDTENLQAQINELKTLNETETKDLQKQIEDLRTELAGKYSAAEVEAKVNELLKTFGISGVENGHFYVDLGLESGLLWATCNIGANSPTDYGNYFAWGALEEKQELYNIANSPYYDNETSSYSKYTGADGDGKTELEAIDDVAIQLWQGNWRMPSVTDYEELLSQCDWSWNESLKGYEVKSKKNGNSIFFSMPGFRYNDSNDSLTPSKRGTNAYYWSSSLNEDDNSKAYYLVFTTASAKNTHPDKRAYGFSVRAVCKLNTK